MNDIDITKVIKRLKRELGLKYDADLARQLPGIERTYLAAMKSRGEFTGAAWDSILQLCDKKRLDINYVVFGRSVRSDQESTFVANLIRHIASGHIDTDQMVDRIEDIHEQYSEDLPKEEYREELLRFAQKLIEAAL